MNSIWQKNLYKLVAPTLPPKPPPLFVEWNELNLSLERRTNLGQRSDDIIKLSPSSSTLKMNKLECFKLDLVENGSAGSLS
jgi:hypothetical protein